MIYQRSALLASACALLLSAAQSQAQTAQEKKEDKISVLEEIVVTAQKRQENLQEVPIAVTALTAETRELVGITTLEDMTNFVPGLTYEGQLDRANIRGVGRVTNQPGTDPGIALYTNGVYNSSTTSAARNSIFVDRVEVLRGPQSTLYGRNTTGGAINTVSRQPKDEFGTEARASYGNYDRRVFAGTVTGPVTDWLSARATGALTRQDGGYFTNTAVSHLGDPFHDEGGIQNDKDLEMQFQAKFGEDVQVNFRYSHQEQFGLPRYSANFTPVAYSAATSTAMFGTSLTTGLPITQAGTFTSRGGLQPSSLFNGVGVSAGTVYTVPNPTTPNQRRLFSTNVGIDRVLEHSNQYSPTLSWHLPAFDFKWVGAYTEYKFHSFSDSDGIAREAYTYQPGTLSGTGVFTPTAGTSAVDIYTGSRFRFFEDKEYTSNEINLTSNGDGALKWIAALYQYHERYEQIPIALETSNPDQMQLHTVYVRPSAAVSGTAAQQVATYNSWTQVAYDNPTGATSSSTGIAHASTYAAFGQVEWKLSDTWKLTTGGRISRDEKDGQEKRFAVIWDPSVAGAAAKAYDNSAPLDCYTDGKSSYTGTVTTASGPKPINPNYQRTIDVATGNEVALTSTSSSLTAFCRSRTIDKLAWTDWTGALGVDWKPADHTLAYAKYSRGYKSGAIRFGSFALDAVTDPEHVNTFEVGAKTTIASRLQINSSLFYYDYRNYQFPVSERVDNGDGTSTSIQSYTNLEKAESFGGEIEMTWRPISDLSILLTYAYLHTEIKSDLYLVDNNDLGGRLPDSNPDRIIIIGGTPPAVVAQNVKGSELPGSPAHKAAANVNYTFRFSAGSLIPSVSYSWRASQSSAGLSVSAFSRDGNSTPSYGTADARITWADADGRYSIIGWASNALDDETVNSASVDASDPSRTVYNLNPPRTLGIEFQYRFGSEKR